jgi:cytochrome d ubiquinol oxidase subunit II
VIALVALAVHGALYLAMKTERELQARARKFAQRAGTALVALTIISLPASVIVRRDMLWNYRAYPILFAVPIVVALGLFGIFYFSRRDNDRKAFASSCLYLGVMLAGAAIGLYPRLLPSSSDSARDITIWNAMSGPYALHVGLVWWSFGMLLAITYFVIVYRMFRGKVSPEGEGYGH